jgi:hypothetical protein
MDGTEAQPPRYRAIPAKEFGQSGQRDDPRLRGRTDRREAMGLSFYLVCVPSEHYHYQLARRTPISVVRRSTAYVITA